MSAEQVGNAIQPIAAAACDSLTEVLGVPVNHGGGEQVQPGHPEMLPFGCPVANFTLAANTQRILEGVMGFALVQADLGATLHIG
ncbi:hypothetical protein SAMN06295998_12915 [Primorskyibacter flagellatus]|uniref:Uncharacterized protein n=1 Tax=Primorskyibacter flagellatus TaxID=1387277 RepID=A0A1W2EI47_9RHOB|nr:hypothetical protein SAMN06295998_12915 [Primorskyibacter flagellatus]